ncbi:MAG: PAS domain S-box protein [Alphaproteobacteria bacterium]|nr:MAG: PAS domain S-box protein [Alphaproteobacteria bacterium]
MTDPTQQTLIAQPDLLTMVESLTGIGHWRWQADSAVQEYSVESLRILGFETSPVALDQFFSTLHPDDYVLARACLHLAMETKRGFDLVLRVTAGKDATVRTIAWRGQVLPGATGAHDEMVGTIQDVTAEKRSDELLIARERRYHDFLNHLDEAVVVCDTEGRVQEHNRQACAFWGLNHHELLAKTASELGLPGFNEEEEAAMDMTITRLDGSKLSVSISHFPASCMEPDRHLFLLRDLSYFRRIEDSLRSHQSFQEVLLDTIINPIYYSDQQGRIGYCNKAFSEALGVARERIVGKTLFDIMPHSLADVHKRSDDALIQGRSLHAYEALFPFAEGSIREVLVSKAVARHPSTDEMLIVCTMMDVSQIKRSQRSLVSNERQLRHLLESNPVGALILSEDGLVLDANDRLAEMVGMTRQHVQAMQASVLYADPKDHERIWNQIAQGHTVRDEPVRLSHAQGEDVWALISAERSLFEEQPAVVIWCYDITRQKKQEVALAKAQQEAEAANQAKSAFLAAMSHEIRTPMNGVVTMSELLARTPLSNEQKAMNEVVHESALALLNIIGDILDFSKIESGQFKLEQNEFSLTDLVDGVVDLLGPKMVEKGLDLVTVIQPDVPDYLEGDPQRIRQIILNLLGNAMKFTEKGGITLTIECVQDPAYDKKNVAHDHKRVLRFAVEDTGIGIPPHIQEHLFRPFVQADVSTMRRYGGTGLGLSICHALVTMMDGRIGINSVSDRGSSFWFTLPLIAYPDRRSAQHYDFHHAPIMVVCNSPMLAQNLEMILRQDNAMPKVLTNMGDVSRYLVGAEVKGQPFQIVILDDRLDHQETWIPKELAKPPYLIRLSSYMHYLSSSRDNAVPGLRQSHLSRPVKPHALRQAMAEAMGLTQPKNHSCHRNSDDMPIGDAIFSPPDIEQARQKGVLILVAEDNPTNQSVIRLLMSKLGFAMELAGTGRQALKMLQEKDYHLLLTDCHMPEMDGYELSRRWRSDEKRKTARERLPIVALTADALPGTRQLCYDAGMDDYLIKPVSISDMESCIRHWLPSAIEWRCDKRRTDKTCPETDVRQEQTQLPSMEKNVDDLPVLDMAYFQELVGDDPAMLSDMLNQYLDRVQRDLVDLDKAFDKKDMTAIRSLSHGMAGSSETAGAKRMSYLTRMIEQNIWQGHFDAASAVRSQIMPAMRELSAVIAALRPSHLGPKKEQP